MKIALALALALLLACGTEPEKPPPGSPPPAPVAQPGVAVPEMPPAAPPPTDPAPPASAAWGEVKDGLLLGLDLDRATYGPGQRITVTVRARNVGPAPLTLFDYAHDWLYHVRFENLDGGPAFLGGAGTFIEYEGPEHVTLKPGEDHARSVGLSDEHRRYLRIIGNRKPGDDWDYRAALPAGKWRATITYSHRGSDGGFWTGTVRSNPVDIAVTD